MYSVVSGRAFLRCTFPFIAFMPMTKNRKVRTNVILEQGFYLVHGATRELKCVTKTKGKGDEKREVCEPLRFRTIGAAKDALQLCGEGFGVLFAPANYAWGE